MNEKPLTWAHLEGYLNKSLAISLCTWFIYIYALFVLWFYGNNEVAGVLRTTL